MILLIFVVVAKTTSAQQDTSYTNINVQDSISLDSTQDKEKKEGTLRIMFKGKPGKSMMYSLLLPGCGQLYNRSYWKIPIVYGVIGYNIYVINERQKAFNEIDNAFRIRVDSLGPDIFPEYSIGQLQEFRKDLKKSLQQSYFSLGIVYILTAIESLVDQHLQSFDVNEDLSLDIQPRWQPTLPNGTPSSVGISMVFTLH